MQRFEEIESQTVDGIVQNQKLKDMLVASNVFFVGDAVSMIETMVEGGKLEVVEVGFYKRSKSAATMKKEEKRQKERGI